MSETSTRIVVSKYPEHGADLRSVSVKGNLSSVKSALRIIINLVELTLCKVQVMDFKKNLDVNKEAKVEAMMVIPELSEPYVIGHHGALAKGLADHYRTKIDVFQDKKIRCVDNNESILVDYHTDSSLSKESLWMCKTP